MDQRRLYLIGEQALAPTQKRKPRRADLELRLPCLGENSQESNRLFGTQRHDHAPDTSQWGPASTECVGTPCHNLSLATCRGTTCWAVVNPPAHKRLAGRYWLDVFGGAGDLAKMTDHLGLCGDVLDAKFGSRYDLTKPFVLLTKTQQEVSTGKSVAYMISPPRQHTSDSDKVISASATMANLHRARMPWIVEHPCRSCLWDVPKIQARYSFAHPGSFRMFCVFGSPWRERKSFWVCNVESRKASRDDARPPLTLPMISRRFQRTHLLSGVGFTLNASKDIGKGVTDLARLWFESSG